MILYDMMNGTTKVVKLYIPVKMNGECGYAENGSVNFDQLMKIRIIATSENDPPCNTQISIEPGMPQASSIGLHIEHQIRRL